MADVIWTSCSCKHIAQDHNEEGRCYVCNCKCTGYDGKKIILIRKHVEDNFYTKYH